MTVRSNLPLYNQSQLDDDGFIAGLVARHDLLSNTASPTSRGASEDSSPH